MVPEDDKKTDIKQADIKQDERGEETAALTHAASAGPDEPAQADHCAQEASSSDQLPNEQRPQEGQPPLYGPIDRTGLRPDQPGARPGYSIPSTISQELKSHEADGVRSPRPGELIERLIDTLPPIAPLPPVPGVITDFWAWTSMTPPWTGDDDSHGCFLSGH